MFRICWLDNFVEKNPIINLLKVKTMAQFKQKKLIARKLLEFDGLTILKRIPITNLLQVKTTAEFRLINSLITTLILNY